MSRYVVTVILAIGALGCFCAPMESCGAAFLCRTQCDEEGKCSLRTEFAGDSPYRCYPSSDDDCADSLACEEDGLCSYVPAVDLESCVARTSADCHQSTGCLGEGRCTLRNGRCVISSAGCTRSQGCRARGACHLKIEPVPGASGTEHGVRMRCEAQAVPDEQWCSTACLEAGMCTRRGNECVATSDEDCQQSRLCAGSGRCSVGEDDTCVATSDEDCAESTVCKKHNRCVALDSGDYCVPSNEPCTGSDLCSKRGWCTPFKGICRAGSDEDCQNSRYCETEGDCALSDHLCRPGEDAHCTESVACDVEGKCAFEKGSCQPAKQSHCKESLGCEIAGLCELKEGRFIYQPRCVVGATADCADSYECDRFGRCVAKPDPSCRGREHCPLVCAAEDQPARLPCVSTRFCKDEGRCVRRPVENPETAFGNIRPRSEECVARDQLSGDDNDQLER